MFSRDKSLPNNFAVSQVGYVPTSFRQQVEVCKLDNGNWNKAPQHIRAAVSKPNANKTWLMFFPPSLTYISTTASLEVVLMDHMCSARDTLRDHPQLLCINQSAKKRIRALMFWWRRICSIAALTLCLPFLPSIPEPALFRTPLSCRNRRWGGLYLAQCQISHWLHQLDKVNSLLPNLNTSLVLSLPTAAITLTTHNKHHTESLNALWHAGSLWTWVQCSKLNKWLKGLAAVCLSLCLLEHIDICATSVLACFFFDFSW